MRNPTLPGTRLPLARLALVLAGHLLGFGLVYVLTVQTATVRQLADASLRGAIAMRPLFSGTVQTILDVVSVASLLGAVAVVAVIALVRLVRLQGLAAIGILVGANASTWLLKNVLLNRPDLELDEIAPPTLNSLPSGHATAVFSAVAALLFVAPPRWRDATATIGAGYAALTGLATMLAGWHRAADSIAAFLVVGAWTAVAAAGILLAAPRQARGTAPAARPPSVRWLLRATWITLALGAMLGVGLLLASLPPDNVLGSVTAFAAGGFFVIGTAAAATVAVLETLHILETAVAQGPSDSPPVVLE